MATSGEKKALLFLSSVLVLGSAARLVAAYQVPDATPAEQAALQGQIRAVDSVRAKRKPSGGGKRAGNARPRQQPDSSQVGMPAPPGWPASPGVGGSALVDVDRASAAELEALPGVGPALAARIVAERDSSGPFGAMDDLQARVRGVGPALARRLGPTVTFSGPRRPPSAERTQPFGNGGTATRPKRRRHQ